jgi:hypothetical protein
MDSQWRDARSEGGMPLIDDGCWSHVAWSYAGGAEGVGVEGAGRQMQRNSKFNRYDLLEVKDKSIRPSRRLQKPVVLYGSQVFF